MIPDEAVEAAHARIASYVDDTEPESWKDVLRLALEAAAPYMLREAQAEVWDEGWGAPGYATNPYRSQA